MEQHPQRTASTSSPQGRHSTDLSTSSKLSCGRSCVLLNKSVTVKERRRTISGSDTASFPTQLPRRSKSVNDLDGLSPADEAHHGRLVPLPTASATSSASPTDAPPQDLRPQYIPRTDERVRAIVADLALFIKSLVHINLPPEERLALRREMNLENFGTTYRK